MHKETTRTVESTFLNRLQQEFDHRCGQHVGLIYASIDFDTAVAACAAWVCDHALADMARRLRTEVPGCGWVDGCDGRIRLLARGSLLDLMCYTEQAVRCLDRTRRMEGAAPFTAEVDLTIATDAEGPAALLRRAQVMLADRVDR